MRKFMVILFFISFLGQAQDNIIYKRFNSFNLNQERILKIYVPDSFEENDKNTYPVAVVLDAEFLFDVYVANSKLFAARDKAPEQIVVGIFQNQNEERYTDCDYSEDTGLPNQESSKFYGFIRDELLPYLDDNYPTSLFKTIIGNTLTANFINYFFLEETPVFNAYININPSFASGLHEKLESKSQSLITPYYYYLSGGDYNTEKRTASINDTHNLLKLSENPNFKYKYDDFSNSSKTASIGQSVASAIGFTYRQFAAISKEEFDEQIADMEPGDAIEYLERKYVEIEYLYGSNVKIRESDIYKIEPIIIDKANGDYLEEFGKMIMRLYPETALGDYYIGLYYETGYEYKKALKHYKNGYAKIGSDNPNSDGYYANIERVLEKQRAERLGYNAGEEVPEEELPEEENQG
ncbi:alpha/beta hydrolase [Lutimonas vermicola]|uniref:Alpha/beta hydrolase-fold protein n=1 Tax=Lutimonas vermicola TaxID=414288 RepID=A0ABU9L073_9FLAO